MKIAGMNKLDAILSGSRSATELKTERIIYRCISCGAYTNVYKYQMLWKCSNCSLHHYAPNLGNTISIVKDRKEIIKMNLAEIRKLGKRSALRDEIT